MDTYDKVTLLYRGVLYVEVILYSKECNWYTRCCPLNGGVRYRECPLREATLYYHHTSVLNIIGGFKGLSVLSVEISLNFTKLYKVLPVHLQHNIN